MPSLNLYMGNSCFYESDNFWTYHQWSMECDVSEMRRAWHSEL